MKLLIINPGQFGYKAGYYHYCKHLSLSYKIDFICLDQGLPKLHLDNVTVHYIKKQNSFFNWRFSFFSYIKKIDLKSYDIIFLYAFRFAFLFRLYGIPYDTILDIRTGVLSNNKFILWLGNRLIKFESLFFKHIAVLSESLRLMLSLSLKKTTIIPLGSDTISTDEKIFDYPRLIYIGTFNNRQIHNTIIAVSKFINKFPNARISYDIIGFGSNVEVSNIIYQIRKYNLSKVVLFHGQKNYEELKSYLDNTNVGLSYIPKTSYYDCQPVTKTFDYILSGLVCIATSTSENRKVINKKNGILCDDNSESLLNAIITFNNNINIFNSKDIRNSLQNYKWENIVRDKLEPFFSKCKIR